MEVGASNQMQQQMQMRKMDGSGGGQGKGGMGSAMQSLSSDDKTAIQEQMQSLSKEDKASAMEQIKQLDASSMNPDELAQSMMDIINPSQNEPNTTSILGTLYA
ncbi:MAG: hypothetical protein U9N02_03505 [Campylobacterota bacterium]|nr:hypothetical protein [Campylobacterota bacterium]